ncbi:polysaccharide pyruvyl transferase family protein [Jeotgalibaca porci]|uniref:polysaccharide pyruvyl transferase family protein n=1 Tax=Jeotgalibaca porci TaxID=1868793 RepID=UPI003F8DEA20
MKKIGIITLNGYSNYGNRLQNYALQKTLESLGFAVETVTIESPKKEINKDKEKLSNIYMKVKESIDDDLIDKIKRKAYHFIKRKEFSQSNQSRTNVFKDFTKEFIKETEYSISVERIPYNAINEYEYFITGSDQVWNPNFPEISELYFLTFAPLSKRVAYAPSFGISELPKEYNQIYSEWLSGIKYLSVRENAGADIISELTGRDVQVLVDPTLLLTKEEWIDIAKEAKNKPKKPYLLTYFLGGIPKEFKNQINNIAKNHELEIINLGDIKERDTYRTGPSEFIDYINGCSIFCTDSFHGAVFSILFEKPFIVYERSGKTSMYSRINTLLDKFDFNARKIESISNNGNLFDINYKHVPLILNEERNKAFTFLKNALNIEDEN